MKKLTRISMFIILLAGSVISLSFIKSCAQTPREPGVTCYKPASIEHTSEPTAEDLQNQLNSLEELYKNKKIDEKTYNTRKEAILKKIDELE